jgi:hypothetical protein
VDEIKNTSEPKKHSASTLSIKPKKIIRGALKK